MPVETTNTSMLVRIDILRWSMHMPRRIDGHSIFNWMPEDSANTMPGITGSRLSW